MANIFISKSSSTAKPKNYIPKVAYNLKSSKYLLDQLKINQSVFIYYKDIKTDKVPEAAIMAARKINDRLGVELFAWKRHTAYNNVEIARIN